MRRPPLEQLLSHVSTVTIVIYSLMRPTAARRSHRSWRWLKRLIVFMLDRLLHTSHPFHCSDCGEAFKRRKDLDLHSLTHQGEASYLLRTLEFK